MFHPYCSRSVDWTGKHIALRREKLRCEWRRLRGLDSDVGLVLHSVLDDMTARLGSVGALEDTLEQVSVAFPGTQNVGNEEELDLSLHVSEREWNRGKQRHISWASGETLLDQIHRLAFQLGNDIVHKIMGFLHHGLQKLDDGHPPLAAGAIRIVLAADSHEIDPDGFLGNLNTGNPAVRGSRKRRRGAIEPSQCKNGPPQSRNNIQL